MKYEYSDLLLFDAKILLHHCTLLKPITHYPTFFDFGGFLVFLKQLPWLEKLFFNQGK